MGRRLALLIGNSRFQDEKLAALAAPENDVEALRDALRSDVGGFDDVLPVTNADLISVRRHIIRFFGQAQPDDVLLFYYSGHGILEGTELYLALAGTTIEDIRADALDRTWLQGEMDKSPARSQVIIIDCCHSGAFAAGGRAPVQATALSADSFRTPEGLGRYVLAASDKTEAAFERDNLSIEGAMPQPYGVFTRNLVEAIRTGASVDETAPWVDVNQVFEFARDRTTGQRPHIWMPEGVHRHLEISRNPHWLPPHRTSCGARWEATMPTRAVPQCGISLKSWSARLIHRKGAERGARWNGGFRRRNISTSFGLCRKPWD